MFQRIRRWLRESPHVHIREHGVNNLSDLVELIDRFIDGNVRYALEWDDFASWKNENPNIEEFRQRIGLTEPLLFKKDRSGVDEHKLTSMLLEERNRAAALIGLPPRSL